ncbi:MAG: stage II sporulation protein P [Firmicutes bacterium]|jgi:stage II sporulation protein P|nr:stage II sporulation protein P [Bacillota bacterium]NLL88729.1 stage II sporulation protein P [Bacillota bacterium]
MARLLATLLALLWLLMMFIPTPNLTALDLSQSVYEFSQDLDIDELWEEWLEPGQYMTMLTPEGEVITQTGRRIYEGDEYLTSDNRFYRVVKVEDTLAYTELVEEKVDLAAEFISLRQIREALGLSAAQAQENGKSGLIGIYHTHNAESYIPTDGTDSIDGKGGIHAVGSGFAQSLEKLGVGVEYSENLHLPHDRGAYRRSRSTVLDLLAQNPDAIFDVHRDAAPKDAYAANIGDEWITQVQFVVGRQNQNLGVNRQYAQSLKSAADQLYPGLVKGIFYARGNYNQDLSPLNLLLEVGAHTNSREAAVGGISLFAEVVDFYFYGPQDKAQGTLSTEGSYSAIRTILWVMLFIVATGIAFYIINAGGWRAALDRLRRK